MSAAGMIQIPPRSMAGDVGALLSVSAGVGAAEDGDGGAVANGDVGSAAATAGEGDGDLGIATHAATTTRTASTPSMATARTFIVASFERGRAATTRIRGLEHPRDASTAARVSTTTRSAASRHAERCARPTASRRPDGPAYSPCSERRASACATAAASSGTDSDGPMAAAAGDQQPEAHRGARRRRPGGVLPALGRRLRRRDAALRLVASRHVVHHRISAISRSPACQEGRLRAGRLAPAVGFEPTTKRLTVTRSTTELRRSEGPTGPARPRVGAPSRRRGRG